MRSWIFLIIAIATEVMGTLFLKFTATHYHFFGLIAMYTLVIVSYCSLAIAIKRIPLAVAYGSWESIGLMLIVFFSALFFSEPLTAIKITAILLITLGILLLNHGIDSFKAKV